MRINIIIPNFNKAPFVVKCVESCINQTHDNFKVIFIDNESTDNSLDLVRKFRKESGSDFIIETAPNIYPRCWDECIEKALDFFDGDYYTIVGSDDFLDKNYISNFCGWVQKHKEEVLVSQSDLLWIKEGKQVNCVQWRYQNLEELKRGLTRQCIVNTPTVFYSKEIINNKALKTNPKVYSGASDYDLYCQLADNGIFIHNMGGWAGYFYNVNPSQATWEMVKDSTDYAGLIINKWKNKWSL